MNQGGDQEAPNSDFTGTEIRDNFNSDELLEPSFQQAHVGQHSLEETRPLFRRILWIFTATAVFLALDLIIEPLNSPLRVWAMLQGELEPHAVRVYLTALARVLGVILAASLTLCGIAIPLTANNYTPKLIRIFVKDPVNWSMFGLLVFANVLTHWTLLVAAGTEIPHFNVSLATALALLSIVLLTPYTFYVFRALLPDRIVSTIQAEISFDLRSATSIDDRQEILEMRRRVLENLKYISNIILRSIDRHDRDTALYSLETLRHIIDEYLEVKKDLPEAWFGICQDDFLSKAPDVLQLIEQSHTVFEVEVLDECALILSVSIGRFREGVRMIGVMARHIGLQTTIYGDDNASEMVRVYFNSFLRATISQRNPDAIYMLIFQYRQLAASLIQKNAKSACKVGFYLDYYGHQSVRSGLVFVANVIAYDLAGLAMLAYEINSPDKRLFFDLFLNFDRNETLKNFPGIIKSHVKVLMYMKANGQKTEVEELLREFKLVDPVLVENAFEEIEGVESPFFWEITDRRRHLDYVAPEMQGVYKACKRAVLERVLERG